MPKVSLARLMLRRDKGCVLCAEGGRVSGPFSGVWWKNGEELAIDREVGRGYEMNSGESKNLHWISYHRHRPSALSRLL